MGVLFCASYFNSAIIEQMDDPNLTPNNNNDVSLGNDEIQDVTSSEKVFDITSDMDIKPFQEKVENEEFYPPKKPVENQGIPAAPKIEIKQTPPIATEQKPNNSKEANTAFVYDFTQNTNKSADQNLQQEINASLVNVTGRGEKVVNTNVPQKEEEGKDYSSSLRPLRTYESDVAELLSRKKTSSVTIALAENKRNSGEESLSNNISENISQENSNAGKKILLILVSLILIGSGVVGAYFLFLKSPLAPATPVITVEKITSLVPNDAQVVISIDNLTPTDIQKKIQNEVEKVQEVDTIKEIVLTKTNNNVKSRVSGPEILKVMDITPPDILERSLSQDWMLGVYVNEEGYKDVFVLFTNNFFQNAFAGMLQWESVIADDIKQYLYYSSTPSGIANVSEGSELPPTSIDSELGTSTDDMELEDNAPKISKNFTIRGSFEDRIVRNKDERAFRTYDGDILFIYSFLDNKKLLLATKESTLSEILSRVEKDAFVR